MSNIFFEVYEIKDVKKIFLKYNLILNIFQIFSILYFFFIRNNSFTGITVFFFYLVDHIFKFKFKIL
jgi:hypothetical protein